MPNDANDLNYMSFDSLNGRTMSENRPRNLAQAPRAPVQVVQSEKILKIDRKSLDKSKSTPKKQEKQELVRPVIIKDF